MGRTITDLTGEKFGMLTVVSFDHKKRTRTYWKCVCECGNTRVVGIDHLKNGDTTDCGCYRKHIPNVIKHNMSGSRLYVIWSLMKRRCLNQNCKEYKDYGGRGIAICDEWLDAKNFLQWALDNGYSEELTLERVDNNGNYCPENCIWANKETQMNNRRNNRYITYNGETKTMTQWARDNGYTYAQIKKRIDKLGWSFERAISEPIHLNMSNKKR